jgi:hypothetical protein
VASAWRYDNPRRKIANRENFIASLSRSIRGVLRRSDNRDVPDAAPDALQLFEAPKRFSCHSAKVACGMHKPPTDDIASVASVAPR